MVKKNPSNQSYGSILVERALLVQQVTGCGENSLRLDW
jgi:hypothetical protein